MSDYLVKLVIGSLCMIILAGILAGSKTTGTIQEAINEVSTM